ncbi:MAG: AbrB/MazE/SpoVT family DNA-binding domain-containing protein [Elusimicrobia bacterium]|nr:AbrB/MazE/SpoVT family DNA-binding domain-containing protein [Elusimicrobiota bacterium]
MQTVRVSPKYQVVVPEAVRTSMGLRPGESIQVPQYENLIELIPVRPLKTMRGFLKGIDTAVPRGRSQGRPRWRI